jgi:UDPglucose 6-dehydrogenase
MKIGIIGYGTVGKAVGYGFSNHELLIVDPAYANSLKIEDLKDAECVFIAVNTPSAEDWSCDTSTMESVLASLKELNYKGSVCIKCTTAPNKAVRIAEEYKPLKVVFSPEFLKGKTASEDFKNQEFAIFAGEKSACQMLAKLHEELPQYKHSYFTDIATACLVKYTTNCFLSTKITFFNCMFDAFKKMNPEGNFNDFLELVSLDPRIGTSHTAVPGWDGKRGWGGHCFTKDMPAFAYFAKEMGIDFSLLDEAIRLNSKHR